MRVHCCLAITISLLVVTMAGCSHQSSGTESHSRALLTVHAIKATRHAEFSFPVRFYGRIRPARRPSLAFEIPGQVIAMLVDEGQTIGAGRPIAQLNTTILEAERNRLIASKAVEQTVLRRLMKGERQEVISAARATTRQLDAELEQARRDRVRFEALRSQDAVSTSEYEAAMFKVKSLEASLDAARARLLLLESGTREEDIEAQKERILEIDAQIAIVDARIGQAVLTAPFKAHVVERLVDEGSVVQQGQPVVVLSEADRYEAWFSIPASKLENAKTASFVNVASCKAAVEQVRAISSVSDDTRTVDVIFVLRRTSSFFEGQTCSLNLNQTVKTACARIPVSALVPSVRGLWSVYRLEPTDASESFEVFREEVAIIHTDGDVAVVENSLPDSSLIVSEGTHRLVPGMVVRLKDGGS